MRLPLDAGARIFGVPYAIQVHSNAIQFFILGEVQDLLSHSLWGAWEVSDDETVLWSSEDMAGTFYMFELPEAWQTNFAISTVENAQCRSAG